MSTWQELLDAQAARVGREDAWRVVERASGWERAALIAHLDEAAPDRAGPFLEAMVCRRLAGEPLQYVVGAWSFRRLELVVDSRVLIPRPETEVVVDIALTELRRLDRPRPVVVDLGTGSGAIALSVAVEVAGAQVWATDVSTDALAVASANLASVGTLAATRVRLAEGSWWSALPADLRGDVDLVVSNPPYIADDEVLPVEVAAWEPRLALRSGPSGLEAIGAIVAEARQWLARPGAIVVEIAPHQSVDARDLARRAGYLAEDIFIHPDLSGRDRVLVARC